MQSGAGGSGKAVRRLPPRMDPVPHRVLAVPAPVLRQIHNAKRPSMIFYQPIKPLPIVNEDGFDYIADHNGFPFRDYVDRNGWSAEDRDAVKELSRKLYGIPSEVTANVVRNRATDRYGVLFYARELSHAGSQDDPTLVAERYSGIEINGKIQDGSAPPSLADAADDLQSYADALANGYGLPEELYRHMFIAHGDAAHQGRAALCAFLPQGTRILEHVEAICNCLVDPKRERLTEEGRERNLERLARLDLNVVAPNRQPTDTQVGMKV